MLVKLNKRSYWSCDITDLLDGDSDSYWISHGSVRNVVCLVVVPAYHTT